MVTHELRVTRAKGCWDDTHPLLGDTGRALKRCPARQWPRGDLVFVNERGVSGNGGGFRNLLHYLSKRVAGVK